MNWLSGIVSESICSCPSSAVVLWIQTPSYLFETTSTHKLLLQGGLCWLLLSNCFGFTQIKPSKFRVWCWSKLSRFCRDLPWGWSRICRWLSYTLSQVAWCSKPVYSWMWRFYSSALLGASPHWGSLKVWALSGWFQGNFSTFDTSAARFFSTSICLYSP